ncbi:lipopolysaccharide biosynthesis protein [Clostridium estertheticum]|uniref:lipopolysaccharide biosynthesis protein n=1 Tax=Clostridium estertheticum TaxID=238834 RepID=UPI001CF5BEAF|nr:oligosaccharide flippase family protein [Clostridium estertheticum]MCB2353562.1 oligosaccharide flippase family protein [Clostridium estertheticum]WAG41897.1 oligosaccharide flippase family protein [Clostridium estertheticum]
MPKKQIFINMLSNIFNFVISLGISFFFTPYLISTVGKEAYGFTTLAFNFTSYILIITSALNSMAARFITIKIYENEDETAEVYFNTVLFTNIVMSVLISIIFAFIVLFLDKILNIPINIIGSVKILFSAIFSASIIGLCFSVFGVATFCRNRIDLRSVTSIIQSLVRVILLILFFTVFKPNVAYIGITIFILAIIDVIFNIFFTKKLLPQIKINKNKFDKNVIIILVGAGVWNSFSQLSAVLLTGLDLLIANIFLGPSAMALLAIVKTLPNFITSFTTVISSSFTPQFTILYAKKDYQGLLKEIMFSVKAMGLVISIPVASFVAYGDVFYKLWLPGQNYKLLQILSIITIGVIFISGSIIPLYDIFTITNKLKLTSLTLLLTGIFSFSVTFILLKTTALPGIFLIAGVSTFFIMIREIIFIPSYAAHCLNLKWNTFYSNIFKTFLSTVLIIFIFFIPRLFFNINTWLLLLTFSVIGGFLGLIINIHIILDKSEQQKIYKIIKRKLPSIMLRR